MDTSKLKRFAQSARRSLIEQVSAKLRLVLDESSAARRESAEAVKKLEESITLHGKEQVIERVAYIWFNRFCALRFMDVNRYTGIGTVSPSAGFSQPEILQEAKQGHIDEELRVDGQKVFDLLSGKAVSSEPQQEAYRLLLVATCNRYHDLMPYLFERIADYTELLMPDDLLSEDSILQAVRVALDKDGCQDVEVIGWLYQFYISEKKDEVFAGLKKKKKITPENIPAATQLFTPHWIVRYLVENSLGRLWMLNRPGSKLFEQMDYYIRPEQVETDFLKVSSPEELKICDPACGSGHMLTYAFDLLHAIYEEEGYDQKEIPGLILANNLYGVEIDERAGELAAFALTMKARARQRRFFRRPVQPNICVLGNVQFDESELKNYMDEVGRDLFTVNLQTTLHQFEEADNFGSLIRPDETNVQDVYKRLEAKGIGNNLLLVNSHQKVLQVLQQADYLSPKYHVVIANPPYMGGKGMNGRLGAWAKENYPDSKSDLFAMFIIRNLELAKDHGSVAMITMQSWMFLSSFEALRTFILGQNTILSMAHLGPRAFDSIGGEVVSTTAFVLANTNCSEFNGSYLRLLDGNSESEKEAIILERRKYAQNEFSYQASAADFHKIPGSPVAYWVSKNVRAAFENLPSLSEVAKPRQGLATSDNNRFLKLWFEPSFGSIGFGCKSRVEAQDSERKWFPCQKGGSYRKWYGNNEYLVNWENDGEELLAFATKLYKSPTRTIKNIPFYFREGITWSTIASNFSMRYSPWGFISETKGAVCFADDRDMLFWILAYSNSKLVNHFLKATSPTLDYHEGPVGRLPLVKAVNNDALHIVNQNLETASLDWNSYETSWDFATLPLLQACYRQTTLKDTYQKLLIRWQEMTIEMQRLEEENNRIFIDAYGLQDELDQKVDLSEITLTSNPHYRYGGDKSEEELEALLLGDTMKEFVCYAVGCMFGRYSLDKPGLILANQSETVEDYLKQIPKPTFEPDDDNVIPILDGEWFIDDISGRFRKFLKVTFGEDHYEENLAFIEEAIGKDIRKYFLKDFYKDHVKRYKKRPIYWLFSSPKGSFNALIYMHRYRPDTVSIVLNDYLREFRTKLSARRENMEQISISAAASPGEKTRALNEIEKLKKVIDELETYEHDILYPLATRQIEIDLDDGVKVNYPKFGKALQKVVGLSPK